jgi:hypothetical protein
MSSDDKETQKPSFWTGMNGVVTAVAALLTAAAGLLVALFQTGVVGDDSGSTASTSISPPTTAAASPSETAPPSEATASPTETPVAASQGPGAGLAGTWAGVAAGGDGAGFDVVLTIEPTCEMRKPCGTIFVSSAPCSGRVRLWGVESATYEFYVDKFSGDSSPDCTPGAGEYFERVDDGHLRYTTGYSDAVGVLQRQ